MNSSQGSTIRASRNCGRIHISLTTSLLGFEDVPANSKASLLKAVANQPVSVAIDASGFAFQLYSGGVFTGDCGAQVDHRVTAGDYGPDSDGTTYWLVKNSWGSSWGENGWSGMWMPRKGFAALPWKLPIRLLDLFACLLAF